ncbi:MAG TPA: hypothetical protein VLJ37_05830, partial [bacterium]|nr:hypothetical protein [bacterium]
MAECRALPSNFQQILTEIDQQDAKNATEKARQFPLLDLYRRLDARHQFDSKAAPDARDAFTKMGLEGRPADLPYMDGEAFRLDVYTDDNLACLFRTTGYDREKIDKAVKDARAKGGDEAVDSYTNSLRPIHRSIYNALSLFDDIRKQYGADGKMDRDEYTKFVEKEFGATQTDEEFAANGQRVVENAHVILGLLNFLTTPAPKEPDAKAPDAGAPDPVPPVASGGPRVVSSSVPGDAGADSAPAPVNPAPAPASPDGGLPDWLKYVIGAGGAAALYGLYRVFTNRGDAAEPKHPDAKAAVRQQQIEDDGIPSRREKKPRVVNDTTEAKPAPEKAGPKVVKDTTGPAQGESKPPAGGATVAMADDIAEALKGIDDSKSPAGGARPSGAPAPGGVTPENVIISGPNAEAVSGVDPHVIRAQIVLTYRRFLSQTARDALLGGKDLPAGGDLVNSAFTERVNEMVDAVMREYHKMSQDDLTDMWR